LLTGAAVALLILLFPAAMREMLDTEGPYLLEVMVPHIEHVLPMIPGGATFKDIITEGDGSIEY
jgi:acetolactate synthase-1/2/3 large subunit